MRAHRQLRQRLARIEGQQSRLPADPESLRQAMIRTVQKTMPLDEATEFIDDLLAMPYPDARALIIAEIERREAS
jgi:hypothetical protein